MEQYLTALDEFFCAQYSDYVRLSALSGYVMPEMLTVGRDGNIARRDSEAMRLIHQPRREELLARFKAGRTDTDFMFSFLFPPFGERLRDRFRKYTFAKVLPEALKHSDMTPEQAGEKLEIEPVFWEKIVKGKLYPSKNTVIAVALVGRLGIQDANNLFAVCGYTLETDSVRDVVAEYLLSQKIFNEEMRDRCLAEYSVSCLPIKRTAKIDR